MDNIKTNPLINIGNFVEVILNEKNSTYHCGWVYLVQWHHKDNCHYYYILEKNHKISKRYSYGDLTVRQLEIFSKDLIVVGCNHIDQDKINNIFKYNVCKFELTEDQYKDSNRTITVICSTKKEYTLLSIDGIVPGKIEDYIYEISRIMNMDILVSDTEINPYSWIMYSPNLEKFCVKLDSKLFDEKGIIKYVEKKVCA